MNRKTNIFYSDPNSNDSRFITFDNYTEALTGDVLATNQKLWPSRFICVNIKNLDKQELIDDYITPYYENKLAYLRDIATTNDDLNSIQPLQYLINILYFYAAKKNSHNVNTINEIELAIAKNTIDTSEFIDFCYISDIVEQNYNGTYTDIICTINPNKRFKPSIKYVPSSSIPAEDTTGDSLYVKSVEYAMDSTSVLYGWQNETSERIASYINKNLIFDKPNKIYNVDSLIRGIDVIQSTNKIEFNLVIPLFDSVYINSQYNIQAANELVLDASHNVPLGLYFSDEVISLDISDNGFSSNWSLMISMQFKPFPYSFDIQNHFVSTENIREAYVTFAQILSKQTNFIDLLNKYNENLISLQNRVSLLQSSLNNVSSTQNIDEVKQDIVDFEYEQSSRIDALSEKIDQLEDLINRNRIRWQIKNKDI